MDERATDRRRRYYGVAEVADALGLNRQLVTVWRRRRSWGMPEPDDELASGPLWRGPTIEPWIEATRARLAAEATDGAAPLAPDAARRAGRRLLRLLALLLEDAPRAALVARALRDLEQAEPAVAAAAPAPGRDALLAAMTELRAAATGDGPPGAADAGVLTVGLTGLDAMIRVLRETAAVPWTNGDG